MALPVDSDEVFGKKLSIYGAPAMSKLPLWEVMDAAVGNIDINTRLTDVYAAEIRTVRDWLVPVDESGDPIGYLTCAQAEDRLALRALLTAEAEKAERGRWSMAELSPEAQAVLDAITAISPAPADEIAAVTIRAVIDHIKVCNGPVHHPNPYGEGLGDRERNIVMLLNCIAAELEAHHG